MKIVAKTLRITIGLVFFSMILLFIYYYYDKDYLEGDVRHYIGTTNVTQGQVVDLLSANVTVGAYYGQVEQLRVLDNGLVEIDYDFYSGGIYPFLIVADFSYFDTTLVNMIRGYI